MRYRALGRTGMQVSEVGFGCGNVGGLMVRGSQLEQMVAVRRAVDLGFNYFDTAPSYGDTLSEANLGKVLTALRPDVFVGTKVGIGPGNPGETTFSDIKGSVARSLELSLKRLQRDHVDVLYLHNPITKERGAKRGSIGLDDVLDRGGVLDALEDVKAQGLARNIGFTALGDTEAVHAAIESGRFDVAQFYYNLLNPSAGDLVAPGFYGQDFRQAMAKARVRGMGAVVIRVMAGGALAGAKAREGYASPTVGGEMAEGGDYAGDAERAAQMEFLSTEFTQSMSEAALRFALSTPAASTALVGFSNLSQVVEAAAAGEAGPLPDAALRLVHEVWAAASTGGYTIA